MPLHVPPFHLGSGYNHLYWQRALGPRAWLRLAGWLGLLVASCVLSLGARAENSPARVEVDNFSPLVKLAPLVVHGEQLSVSIHARSGRDRRYAEGFAAEVIKVVYESVTEETGKGLVIIGKKGEPHPIFVFRKFLALAEEGKLDPAVAARGPELFAMLNHWQHHVDDEKPEEGQTGGEVDMDFDKIVTALPLPLEGIGAKLYQLAWAEKFDDAKVAARLQALQPADLERDWFTHFDWVFYLPPRGAFDQVVDELIAEALKDEELGGFTRTVVKGALLIVKPKIRKAIEAMRRGVMFTTVVRARTHCSDSEVSVLTETYVEVQMPGEKRAERSEHERAVQAVRERIRLSAEKARTSPAKTAAEAIAEAVD